jgi:iron-sulfur cluster insertion protein
MKCFEPEHDNSYFVVVKDSTRYLSLWVNCDKITRYLGGTSMSQAANVIFTDAAANKVQSLIDEENNPNLKLRVYITGGGCSGMQYGFTFDEKINEDDWSLEKNGVHVLINAVSYMYLENAEIDYTDGITGEQFIIRNPNAQTTCGCGSSFAVGETNNNDEE